MSEQTTVTIAATPELLEQAADSLRKTCPEAERLPELMELGHGRLALLGAAPEEPAPTLDGLEDNETELAMHIARGLLAQIAKRQAEIKEAKGAIEPLVKALGAVEAAGLRAEWGPGYKDVLAENAWNSANAMGDGIQELLDALEVTPAQAKRAVKAKALPDDFCEDHTESVKTPEKLMITKAGD